MYCPLYYFDFSVRDNTIKVSKVVTVSDCVMQSNLQVFQNIQNFFLSPLVVVTQRISVGIESYWHQRKQTRPALVACLGFPARGFVRIWRVTWVLRLTRIKLATVIYRTLAKPVVYNQGWFDHRSESVQSTTCCGTRNSLQAFVPQLPPFSISAQTSQWHLTGLRCGHRICSML